MRGSRSPTKLLKFCYVVHLDPRLSNKRLQSGQKIDPKVFLSADHAAVKKNEKMHLIVVFLLDIIILSDSDSHFHTNFYHFQLRIAGSC